MFSTRKNPLVLPILDLLKQAPKALSEYDIIRHLGAYFTCYDDLPYQLQIFKKHFLTMNALYHLQETLVVDGFYLSISALEIQIEPIPDTPNATDLVTDVDAKLRDYYLDWQHYEETQVSDVEALFQAFWKQYVGYEQQEQAVATLGLTVKSSWSDIQVCYRQKVNQCHPDKGGQQAEFIDIRKAYEILKCYYDGYD